MAAGKVSKFVVGVSSSKLNLEEAKVEESLNVTLYSAVENGSLFTNALQFSL